MIKELSLEPFNCLKYNPLVEYHSGDKFFFRIFFKYFFPCFWILITALNLEAKSLVFLKAILMRRVIQKFQKLFDFHSACNISIYKLKMEFFYFDYFLIDDQISYVAFFLSMWGYVTQLTLYTELNSVKNREQNWYTVLAWKQQFTRFCCSSIISVRQIVLSNSRYTECIVRVHSILCCASKMNSPLKIVHIFLYTFLLVCWTNIVTVSPVSRENSTYEISIPKIDTAAYALTEEGEALRDRISSKHSTTYRTTHHS